MRIIKKFFKRIEACILIVIIVLSALPMVWAEMQPGGMFVNNHFEYTKHETHVESYIINELDIKTEQHNGNYSYDNFNWTNTLNTYAEIIDNDTFKLTMSVTGSKITPPPVPVVCVLVLDVSNSMNQPGTTGSNLTKIQELRAAVKNFADGFLSASRKNCLSIVTYSDYANVLSKSGTNDFYGAKDRNSSALNSAINGLVAEGGTNTQGGLLKSYSVLRNKKGLKNYLAESEINGAEYIVILMSDGGANEYYRLGSPPVNDGNTANTREKSQESEPYESDESDEVYELDSPDIFYYNFDNIHKALLNYNTPSDDYAIGGDGTQIWTPDGQNAASIARDLLLGIQPQPDENLIEPLPNIPKLYTVGFDMSDELNDYLAILASEPNYAFKANDGSALINTYTDISNQINSPAIAEGSILTNILSEYFEFAPDWFIGASIGVTKYKSPSAAGASISSSSLISAVSASDTNIHGEADILTWILGQNVGADITATISVKIRAKPNAYSLTCDDTANGKIAISKTSELMYWNLLKSQSEYVSGKENTYYYARFTSPVMHVQKQMLPLAVNKSLRKLERLKSDLIEMESALGKESDTLNENGQGSLYAELNAAKTAYESYMETITDNFDYISVILKKVCESAEIAVKNKLREIADVNKAIKAIEEEYGDITAIYSDTPIQVASPNAAYPAHTSVQPIISENTAYSVSSALKSDENTAAPPTLGIDADSNLYAPPEDIEKIEEENPETGFDIMPFITMLSVIGICFIIVKRKIFK